MKESDRLETIARTLHALGAKAQEGEDTLTIQEGRTTWRAARWTAATTTASP